MDTLNEPRLDLSGNPSTSNDCDKAMDSSACAEAADDNKPKVTDGSTVTLQELVRAVAVMGEEQGSSSENDAFKCPQCGKCLSGPSSFSRHMKTHNKEKPYKCVPCNKMFSRLSSLKRHQGAHAQERPFKCTVCGWTFLQNSDLKIHERTHTGEKPFACDRCEQTFGCKKRLRAHYRKHTGEKPYKCPQCEKSFSMKKNVIQHLRIHTGERPFTCWVCKKAFRHQHTLKKHIRLHADKNEALDQCIQKIKDQQPNSKEQVNEAQSMAVEIVVMEKGEANVQPQNENKTHKELEEAVQKGSSPVAVGNKSNASVMEKKTGDEAENENRAEEIEAEIVAEAAATRKEMEGRQQKDDREIESGLELRNEGEGKEVERMEGPCQDTERKEDGEEAEQIVAVAQIERMSEQDQKEEAVQTSEVEKSE